MSFFILIGKKDFDSHYEVKDTSILPSVKEINKKPSICNDQCFYCPNCKNLSVQPIKRKEFITLFFIPVLPIYWGKQLKCPVCNWRQDFSKEEELNIVKGKTIEALS